MLGVPGFLGMSPVLLVRIWLGLLEFAMHIQPPRQSKAHKLGSSCRKLGGEGVRAWLKKVLQTSNCGLPRALLSTQRGFGDTLDMYIYIYIYSPM